MDRKNYMQLLTEEDVKTIISNAFSDVVSSSAEYVELGTRQEPAFLAKVKRASVPGEQKYTITEFMVEPFTITTIGCDEMLNSYLNFMINTKNENGELRFPNFEADLFVIEENF